MGYMVLTDFHTFAPVILRTDRIIEVTETKLRGTCLRTEYESRPDVYVTEPAMEVYWKWQASRSEEKNDEGNQQT